MPGLRATRQRLGLTASEAASVVGVTQWTVLAWEKQEIGVSQKRLPLVADRLGVAVDALTSEPPETLPTVVPATPAANPPGRPRGIPVPGLRAIRYRMELGVPAFALLIGVSPRLVTRYETGKVGMPPKRLTDVAARLGVDESVLTAAPSESLPPASTWMKRGK